MNFIINSSSVEISFMFSIYYVLVSLAFIYIVYEYCKLKQYLWRAHSNRLKRIKEVLEDIGWKERKTPVRKFITFETGEQSKVFLKQPVPIHFINLKLNMSFGKELINTVTTQLKNHPEIEQHKINRFYVRKFDYDYVNDWVICDLEICWLYKRGK